MADLAKATPRPWRAQNVPGSYQRPSLVMARDKLVASCMGNQLEPSATSIGAATANAALIVKAVNSYDARDAALRDVESVLSPLPDKMPDTDELVRVLNRVREVLAS